MKFASSPAHCIAGMEEAMDASMSIASAATSFLKDIIPELSLEPWKRPENSLTAPFERPLNPLGRSETSCFRPFQGLERGSEDFSTPSVQLLKPTKLFCKEAATTPGFATAPCAAESPPPPVMVWSWYPPTPPVDLWWLWMGPLDM